MLRPLAAPVEREEMWCEAPPARGLNLIGELRHSALAQTRHHPGNESTGHAARLDGEQRRLDEIERAFYRDDPRFAAGQSFTRLRWRRLIAAAAVGLIGMVLLVVGPVMTSSSAVVGVVLISVTGFLVMVRGGRPWPPVGIAPEQISPLRDQPSRPEPGQPGAPYGWSSSSGL